VGISLTLAKIEIYTKYVGVSTTDNTYNVYTGLNLNYDIYMFSLLFLFIINSMFNLILYIVLLCDVQIKTERFSTVRVKLQGNLATNLKTGSRHM